MIPLRHRFFVPLCAALTLVTGAFAAGAPTLYDADFKGTRYGRIPDGWRDLIDRRPSRNWAVDGEAFVRVLLKHYTGVLVYDGYLANGRSARGLQDATLEAEFKTTGDESVAFAVAARVQDPENCYLARFAGDSRLELVKVKGGKSTTLASLVTTSRYRDGQRWKIAFTLRGPSLTATAFDETGRELARVNAQDADFTKGRPGLCCTTFAAATSFRVHALEAFTPTTSTDRLARRNALISGETPNYPVVKPYWRHDDLDTPRAKISPDYDVIVAGAGTGGWAAAVQAARQGARVLLLEETDWIGGQMCAAAVASMDEDSVWHKFPVRERGIYREFHESMALYYYSLDKDPFVAYFSNPYQIEGGYEPKAARAVLYGFIHEARGRKLPDGRQPVLDVSLRSRVTAVRRQGDTVTGATIAFADANGASQREIACRILIDATEYGDVIPLTGARYRVGNTTSERPDPKALVQDHTWTAVVREYPGGVPEHLQLKSPPPGYEAGAKRRYKNYQLSGLTLWGAAGKGIKGPRVWRVFFAWRGMADSDSTLTGERSGLRHTQTGFNGGNDYPVTAATIEDPAQRLLDEREGIYKTLGALYYFQHDLGLNWSLAEDEGFDTPYNRAKMKQLDLRPDLAALAVHLPQQPYVRECRRIIGVRTLVAGDLTRFEQAKLFPTSVAMGDYFMDLDHGKTAHAIETDLDSGEPPRGGGPFQVPFEVFLPEKLDGFLPAEKNFSQSRLANGATRLQPVTMLTGQAAGAIAALAVKQQVQPRALAVPQVQGALLDAGCTLVQRWHSDVPWGTPLWKATQLLALYQVMDRPGPITKDEQPLAAGNPWGATKPLTTAELQRSLQRLLEINGQAGPLPAVPPGPAISLADLKASLKAAQAAWGDAVLPAEISAPAKLNAGEFALVAARILLSTTSK
jgi:hypothetical protein